MPRRTRHISRSRPSGVFRFGAFAIVLAALAGFVAFSVMVTSTPTPPSPRAEAIVVLTGGDGRLQSAAQLLDDDSGARLLISGVHPDVTADDLRAAMSASEARFDCCVDMGREATDTVGNAHEISAWARSNNYHSLIVVTSDYHLPRSLLELRALMPEADLVAYPVHTPRPWTSLRSAQRWTLEYFKYVAVLTRETAAGRA